MSDKSSGEKSEKPTQGKLRKAKEKGEIARSKDMTMAMGVLASFVTITAFFPYYKELIGESFASVSALATQLDDQEALAQFLIQNMIILFKIMATLAPIPIICCIATLVPGGWIFSAKKLIPDLKKLNPITGLGRLVSSSHLIEVLKMMVKCAIVIFLLYRLIRSSIGEMMLLQGLHLTEAISQGLELYHGILIYFITTIVLFAILDVPLSKFLFTKKLKMTKQEVKEEHRNNEGKPEVKGRVRQLQRQFAMGQINKIVPTANVVITNPTHYAVALKYDADKAAAPYVVAKGADEVALYIREVARKHKIEVVELPPLARAVYYTTKVNQQIPAQLYKAIAYVLTYVLQLDSWRSGKAEKPMLNKHIPIPKEVLKQHGS